MKWLVGSGLIMNFIGALLIWKFVPPSPLKNFNGKAMGITNDSIGRTLELIPKYERMTKVGLCLLSLGFLLQLISLI